MNVTCPEIRVENLTKSYGQTTVLSDFSAIFKAGKITALMGESGSGKTTLLRILAGLEKPNSGKMSGITRVNYSFAFQEDRLFPFLNLFENVRLFLQTEIKNSKILNLLSEFNLADTDTLLKHPCELSGGMKRRVAIARALLFDKPILILDEPIKGLDLEMAKIVNQTIKKYAANRTTIIATHSLADAQEFCDEIVSLPKLPNR